MRDLPPHQRLVAWPVINRLGALEGVTVTVPPELAASPPSLACYSRAVRVAHRPSGGDSPLDALLTSPESAHVLAEPLRLVITLALWDEVIREGGVYGGNIYLASERSVGVLLHTAHTIEPAAADRLAEILEQLHALELLYRFPVAYKFRGTHGLERQCRINGWGRLLFRLLDAVPDDPYGIRACRARLTEHVRTHRDAYRRGVIAASAAEDSSGARIWADIHAQQPIPVLI
ncbi:hypothetical protein [Streptomyces sp. 2131.1]|uniref:hypothetical protein n=1 Tax=Streptomyces sp. 2131.1 TaxID=1855346 RepID=UPI0015A2C79E|nr:hypothetical protein [Streptomyces sp. 2131.1]